MKFWKRIDDGRSPWTGEIWGDADERNGPTKLCISALYIFLNIFFYLLCDYYLVGESSDYRVGKLVFTYPILSLAFLHRYFPQMRKGEKRFQSEPPLGRAKIKWYSIFKGGIGLPYIRLVNNMIFVVCFLDENGVPVSHDLCVRIQKGFGLFWRHSKIRMIATKAWLGRDEEPDETNPKMVYKTMATAGGKIWSRAHKFVIYNNGEVIGEGRIRHSSSHRNT